MMPSAETRNGWPLTLMPASMKPPVLAATRVFPLLLEGCGSFASGIRSTRHPLSMVTVIPFFIGFFRGLRLVTRKTGQRVKRLRQIGSKMSDAFTRARSPWNCVSLGGG